MQIKKDNYNKTEHIKYKALSVHQPYADWIADGIKTIEVRTRQTHFRGKIVICSTKVPEIEGRLSGTGLCITEIYDCVLFKELDRLEKIQSRIDENLWKSYNNYYAWKLRNTRKIIEVPLNGGQGLWNLYCEENDIIEYVEELGERKPTDREIQDLAKKEIELRKKIGNRGIKYLISIILLLLGFSYLFVKFLLLPLMKIIF